MLRKIIITALFAIITSSLYGFYKSERASAGVLEDIGPDISKEKPSDMPTAIFAGGCFWCLESEFRSLEGVLYTRVGYIGGETNSPNYRAITTGRTGHAEAVEITYDPKKTDYEKLTRHFFTKAHDPTQLNRQGVDVGTQYRSEIFYLNDTQKETAMRILQNVDQSKLYDKPIVTKVSEAGTFWEAEEYHQQYYEKWEEEKGEVHPRVFFKKQMKKLKGQ